MGKPMMVCGHAANAQKDDGSPVCVICYGIKPGADRVGPLFPELEGRTARCSYGPHKDVPSSTDLAFFCHYPDKPMDGYYCGCFGWD